MKTKPLTLAILLIVTTFTTTLSAQVTIGSVQPPVAGALLDLKEETTTTRGLGMPRVSLTNLKPTTPAQLSASIGGTGDWNLTEHIGLAIYNAKGEVLDPATCTMTGAPVGLYVWDGTTWVGLGIPPVPVYEVTDPRDSEVYLARNFGVAGDWMLENMRYVPTAADFTHTAASAPSPYTAKYYAYAEGDESPYNPANHPSAAWASKKKNGLLYNWAAATNGENISIIDQGEGNSSPNPIPGNVQQVGVQGICPANWHVPSDKEWNQLEAVFAASATEYTNSAATTFPWSAAYNTGTYYRPSNSTGHGKSMKSPCPPVGSSIASGGDSKTAAAGGFNLLLAGYAGSDSAGLYGNTAFLWSSSSFMGDIAWLRYVNKDNAGVNRGGGDRSRLFFVRCKKN